MNKQRLSLILAVIFIGIAAGLGAAFLSWLIHHIEIWAFGHSEATYRIVTDHTTPQRRIIAMMAGGLFVSVAWWWLQTRCRPVVGINQMIKADTPEHKRPPFFANFTHSLLQIVAVGAGAPVGREVAPRELGALFAGRIADRFAVCAEDRRVLAACGAAAGLAGVYQVPFAGAIFALEILLGTFSVYYAAIAFTISGIAVLTARLTVSPETFYLVAQIDDTLATTLWAALVGLIIGVPAYWFKLLNKQAEQNRYHGKNVLWALPLAFLITAVIAVWLPQILGNGRSAAQTAYWGTSIAICLGLLIAKTFSVLFILRAGGYGGTLTPGLSIGALAGLFIGLIGQTVYPEADVLVATVAGSAAFLAVSMNAPFTAFALVVGFTGQDFDAYLPITVAVGAALATAQLMKKD